MEFCRSNRQTPQSRNPTHQLLWTERKKSVGEEGIDKLSRNKLKSFGIGIGIEFNKTLDSRWMTRRKSMGISEAENGGRDRTNTAVSEGRRRRWHRQKIRVKRCLFWSRERDEIECKTMVNPTNLRDEINRKTARDNLSQSISLRLCAWVPTPHSPQFTRSYAHTHRLTNSPSHSVSCPVASRQLICDLFFSCGVGRLSDSHSDSLRACCDFVFFAEHSPISLVVFFSLVPRRWFFSCTICFVCSFRVISTSF